MRNGLGRSRSGLVAGLDVGCSKVCCFIAGADDGESPRVIGIGQQANPGMRGGAVVDMGAVESAILNAVHGAEQMAGETIDEVVVNLSCGEPTSTSLGIEIAMNGHEIGDADLHRAFSHGQQAQGLNGQGLNGRGSNGRGSDGRGLNGRGSNGQGNSGPAVNDPGGSGLGGNGRQLIHSIPVSYNVDGNRGIRDPRGMVADQLGLNMHIVTAASGAVRNLTTCIQRCHLDVGALVVSSYASGLAALVEDEMELGVTVIDMGGGTTDIAVFAGGSVVHTDVVPVGGMHVTNDIARGLSTAIAHAERMKTLYGHAMTASADERETIDVPPVGEEDTDQTHQVPRSLLVGIIQPRLEETFELVRSHLEASGFGKTGGRRVVLTGGACQLPGLSELAGLILDRQVRIGRPSRTRGLAEATGGPAYATCAGLLNYALSLERAAPIGAPSSVERSGGLFGRFGHWFREHF